MNIHEYACMECSWRDLNPHIWMKHQCFSLSYRSGGVECGLEVGGILMETTYEEQMAHLHAKGLFEASKFDGIRFPFCRKISVILAGSWWTILVRT